ncbi:hypothetical protein C8R47DRAFT_289095 [Mycena vitilis]|nr:hypothetical protein C8R47DRAFT_289095 [Mycena vitilis]
MTSIPPSPYISPSGSSLSVPSVADTITSTAPLTASYRPPTKDYAAAFATLQGDYGMNGSLSAHPTGAVPLKRKEHHSRPAADKPAPSRFANPSSARPRTHESLVTTRRSSGSSERVDWSAQTASAVPVAASSKDAPVRRGEGDKGKLSGVSKLKKIFRLGKGTPWAS